MGTAFDCSRPCWGGSSTLLLGPVTFPLLKSPVSSLCKVMWNGPSLSVEASSLSLLSSVHHTYLWSYKEFTARSRHQYMHVWHRCTSHHLLLYHHQNRRFESNIIRIGPRWQNNIVRKPQYWASVNFCSNMRPRRVYVVDHSTSKCVIYCT